MSICFVYGTRPEAIKISPVVEALLDEGVTPDVVCTGQHTDLLDGTPARQVLGTHPSLGLSSLGTVKDFLRAALPALRKTLHQLDPDLVVVQGDTMSVLAGAKAAHDLGIPIAHLEAGVRTWEEEPWPEETIRQQVTRMATWHFAATPRAVAHLQQDEVPHDHIFLTGNPGISALFRYTNARPGDAVGHTIVITLHRRELRIKGLVPGILHGLFNAVRAAPSYGFIWPVHPAMAPYVHHPDPNGTLANLVLGPPASYQTMAEMLSQASGLLTDSGGLVEEAATLGIPTAILRHHNDRHEAVEAGIATRFDPEAVESAIAHLVRGSTPRTPTTIYGTPDAATTIASHLLTLTE